MPTSFESGYRDGACGGAVVTDRREPGTSGGPSVTSGGRDDAIFVAICAAMMLAFMLVNTLSVLHDYNEHGEVLPAWEPLVWEGSSVVALLALIWPMMAFTRRVWPLTPHWPRQLALHLLALPVFSVLHVLGMGGVRWAAYALAGRFYNPLSPMGQFLYEFRKDLLVYVGFVFLYVVWRLLRSARAAGAAAGAGAGAGAAAGPDAIEVRDGARRHFVPLAEVAWIEAAGNYVELHRGQTPILHRTALSEMERQLAGAGFVRIHRSRLVRRGAIAQVESKPSGDYVVRLTDGRELAGSRRYRRPLLEP